MIIMPQIPIKVMTVNLCTLRIYLGLNYVQNASISSHILISFRGLATIITCSYWPDCQRIRMLDYFALGLLIFVALVLFYGIIVIHDIPYEMAKERKHPQQDAIHVAGWVSLFTLHAIWPFLWIWATLYRPDRGWGFVYDDEEKKLLPKLMVATETLQDKINKLESQDNTQQIESLLQQVQVINNKIAALEASTNGTNNDTKENT